MKLKALITGVTALALTAVTLTPALAANRPTHLTGGQHSCSYTNPEYMFKDDLNTVRLYPGTTRFDASWTPGSRIWQGAWWVTGNLDENSAICSKRQLPGHPGVYGQSYALPLRVSKAPLITEDMTAAGIPRLGNDMWLAADPRETGPHKLERDPRTWEVMLLPGSGGVYEDNPGWHRVFAHVLSHKGSVLTFRGFDITREIRRLGVPGNLWWINICAGGEMGSGSFTVYNFSLHIQGQHPKPHRHHHKHHHRKPRHHHPKPRHPKPPVKHPKPRTWPNCYQTKDPYGTVLRCVYYRA